MKSKTKQSIKEILIVSAIAGASLGLGYMIFSKTCKKEDCDCSSFQNQLSSCLDDLETYSDDLEQTNQNLINCSADLVECQEQIPISLDEVSVTLMNDAVIDLSNKFNGELINIQFFLVDNNADGSPINITVEVTKNDSSFAILSDVPIKTSSWFSGSQTISFNCIVGNVQGSGSGLEFTFYDSDNNKLLSLSPTFIRNL